MKLQFAKYDVKATKNEKTLCGTSKTSMTRTSVTTKK